MGIHIQIIVVYFKKSTSLHIAEYKAGQAAIKQALKAGEKVTLIVDGVKLTGAQVTGKPKMRLRKVADDLVIENPESGEALVELTGFYTAQEVVLSGDQWVMADGSQLQQLDSGVVHVNEPKRPTELVPVVLDAGSGSLHKAFAVLALAAFAVKGQTGHGAKEPTPSNDTMGLGTVGVDVPEAMAGINALEAADGVSVVVSLPTGAAAGDVITVSLDAGGEVRYTLSADDVSRTMNPGGTVHVTLAQSMIAAAGQGSVMVTTSYADAAGNLAANSPIVSTLVIDTHAPSPPGVTLSEDTGVANDFETRNGYLDVHGLEQGGTWEYTLDGTTWQAGHNGLVATGTTGRFVLPHGSYAVGQVQVRQTDAAGNVSGVGALVHPTVVVTPVLDGQGGQDELTQITSLVDGGYVVTWVSDSSAVFVQRFSPDNTAMGGPLQLAGQAPNEAPQITALTDGGYVVTWAASNIFVHRFDGDNLAVGSPIQLNPLGGLDYRSQVTALTDGGFVVTWSAANANWSVNDVMVQRFDHNHTAVGSPHQLNPLGGQDYDSQVTALADGAYVVAWRSANISGDSDVFVQRYDNTNTAVGGPQLLTDLGAGADRPQITALPDGGYVVVWTAYSVGFTISDILVQRFDSQGVAMGSAHRLDGGQWNDFPQIAVLSDGGYVVTWDAFNNSDSTSSVFVQRYDNVNVAQGGQVQVQGLGVLDTRPQITALSDGGYVVAWQSQSADNTTSDVLVQRFDNTNAVVGGPLQMNGLGGDDVLPQVKATTDGGYVLTWQALSADASASDVFVQRVDAQNHLLTKLLPLVVDTSPPSTPVVNPLTTFDATPVITGTATLLAGERLTVTFNGAVFDNVVVDGMGDWRIDSQTAIPSSGTFVPLAYEQSYSVFAKVTDTADNISSDISVNEVTTLTPPPTEIALGTLNGINLNLIGGFTTSAGLHYYYLDQSANGDALDGGADGIDHNMLDALFNGGADTGNTQPGGAVAGVDDARTVIAGAYNLVLPTEAELVAALAEIPNGWSNDQWDPVGPYWSATQTSTDQHVMVSPWWGSGPSLDTDLYVVAIQVVI